MVKIRYSIGDEKILLKAEGHAGAGERGKDLVCAAVSTLICTFATLIGELANEDKEIERSVTLEMRDGYVAIELKRIRNDFIEDKFIYTLYGLETIANKHPEAVDFDSL